MSTEAINWQDFKCRCSSIDKAFAKSRSNPVLTEKQVVRMAELEKKDTLTSNMVAELAELQVKKENGNKIILSDTFIDYLMEYYAWITKGKKPVSKELMYIQYVEKGKDVEKESIALLSEIEGIDYVKNEVRVYNEFLSGEPDVFVGDHIMNATKISDTKSDWDYPGFLKNIHSSITNGNDKQVKGYLDITGAREGEIARCLVNTPLKLVKDMHDALLRRMDVISSESPEFITEWTILERSMYFDDIPTHQRVWRKPVEPFNDFDRNYLYDRVKIAREWLYTFDEMYQKLNK
jgi:hypothetical protein